MMSEKVFHTADFHNVQFVLLDIEGTTSDIHFVKNVLFPYSARELRNFLATHKNIPEVRKALHEVGESSDEANIQKLLHWIETDVKHPSLKTLQGMIWHKGFTEKIFQAHIYPDVLPTLKLWYAEGLKLGIYSSGSVTAQKLYFSHTAEGNLLSLFSAHYDLSIGGKKDPQSYQKIADDLNLRPQNILFLSDMVTELDAAKAAHLMTAQIVRPGTEPSKNHLTFVSLAAV